MTRRVTPPAIDRFRTLRVEDAMNRDVVQIPESSTMNEAAAILAKHGISGAPVVDEAGRCVGMLSATDFVLRERRRAESGESSVTGESHMLVTDTPDEPVHIEGVPEELVGTQMTQAVQTISSRALLLDAARVMCNGHVHRLPALDESGRVAGMITSLDLVAAMVNVIEEAEGAGK